MRDINRSRNWHEIPPTNSEQLRSVMHEVLQTELGNKYFPSHNIHPNYYELLRKTLYWKQVRLDYPTPKSNAQNQANLTPSGKRRGRPPKYVVEERQQQAAAAAAAGGSAAQAAAQQQQQLAQQTAQQHQAHPSTGQADTPNLQQKQKRKRDTIINDQLAQNHSSHTLTESPLLDYGTAGLNRGERFSVSNLAPVYRVRVGTAHDNKVSRHVFYAGSPHNLNTKVDQNFVDVLDEIASTRGLTGEAIELLVQDPATGEEYRLNSGRTHTSSKLT